MATTSLKNRNDSQQNTAEIEAKTNRYVSERCWRLNFAARNQCIADAEMAAHDQEQAEADLYAQRQMAVWALAVGVSGLISIPLTLAGIFFVWRSLALNRDAVNAAIESNRVAREVGEAQARAYLTVTKTEIWYETTLLKPHVILTIKNTGQSPAFDVVLAYKTVPIVQADAEKPEADRPVRTYPLANQIESGAEEEFDVLMPECVVMTASNMPPPANVSLTLEGLIAYQTVFGVNRNETDRECVFGSTYVGMGKILIQFVTVKVKKVWPMRLIRIHKPEWVAHYSRTVAAHERHTGERIDFHKTSKLETM